MNILDIKKVLVDKATDDGKSLLVSSINESLLICPSNDMLVRHSLIKRLASSSYWNINEYSYVKSEHSQYIKSLCEKLLKKERDLSFLFEFDLKNFKMLCRHKILLLPKYHVCSHKKK